MQTGLTTKYNHPRIAGWNLLTKSAQCRICYLIVFSRQLEWVEASTNA